MRVIANYKKTKTLTDSCGTEAPGKSRTQPTEAAKSFVLVIDINALPCARLDTDKRCEYHRSTNAVHNH
jgi:hypothetical protein